eukprot:845716-Pyramimonas_sp.AAC.1
MATPTTVETFMRVAIMVTMVPATTAWPMMAPILIMPADSHDDVPASATKVFERVRSAREADARKRPA